ncbi:MAG: C40 family peptidase [Thermoleophilia bacterium]
MHQPRTSQNDKPSVQRNTGSSRPGIPVSCRLAGRFDGSVSTAIFIVACVGVLALSFTGILVAALPAPALALPSTSTTLVLSGEGKDQVDGLQGQAAAVQGQIDALDIELERVTEEYNLLNVNLEILNQDLTTLRRRLRETRDLHQVRQTRFAKRLADTYKSERTGSSNVVAMLLTTKDFSDFLERLFLITKVNIQDQILVDQIHDAANDIDEIAAQIVAKKDDALAVRRELEEKRAQIENLLSERLLVLQGLDSQIAALIEQERARQEAERLRLEAEFRSRLTGWERYDGPLPQIEDAVLRQIVETAATYLGIPYVWGGERPSTGLDCSGLLQYVYRQHGVDLPHYSGYQAQMGIPVPVSEIAPGDLIAFGSPVHHVGMYIGDGLFVHAPRTGDVVKITPLSTRGDIATVRRFPLQERAGSPTID